MIAGANIGLSGAFLTLLPTLITTGLSVYQSLTKKGNSSTNNAATQTTTNNAATNYETQALLLQMQQQQQQQQQLQQQQQEKRNAKIIKYAAIGTAALILANTIMKK